MPRNIIMAASLPAESDRLFDMYLDAAEHANRVVVEVVAVVRRVDHRREQAIFAVDENGPPGGGDPVQHRARSQGLRGRS